MKIKFEIKSEKRMNFNPFSLDFRLKNLSSTINFNNNNKKKIKFKITGLNCWLNDENARKSNKLKMNDICQSLKHTKMKSNVFVCLFIDDLFIWTKTTITTTTMTTATEHRQQDNPINISWIVVVEFITVVTKFIWCYSIQ